MINAATYQALPNLIRRMLSDLDRCRAQAEILGMKDEFEDVFVLGNDAMRTRVGPQYEPSDILQTLQKYHIPRPKKQEA